MLRKAGEKLMENYMVYFGIFLIVLIFIGLLFNVLKRSKWVDRKDFDVWKYKVNDYCDEQVLEGYMAFLKEYKGGYVKRRNGKIVFQDFLGKEKGDLKGIFYHVIVPSKHISVREKENFRNYLREIGVNGVENRPAYEKRDGKLKADINNKEEYNRKLAGNRGEQKVRDALKELDENNYFVVSGIVLKTNDQVKEFDHIVISNDAMFVLETKAFGMAESENGIDKAELYIDENDNWKIKKYGKFRDVKSPTKQIEGQKDFMRNFVVDIMPDITYILVLSNSHLKVSQKKELDYEILNIEEMIRFIKEYKGIMNISEKFQLISQIEQNRVN